MADDNVRHLNQNVTLNLDELERDSKPPFSFVVAGERVVLKDPHEIDFKDLMEIDHPAKFLRYALDDAGKDVLSKADVPGWKFNKVIEAYMDYYGLDPKAGKGWLG